MQTMGWNRFWRNILVSKQRWFLDTVRKQVWWFIWPFWPKWLIFTRQYWLLLKENWPDCCKVYIWDLGHIYLNQKAKISTCTFWVRMHVIVWKNIYLLCLNILYILLITKSYSILISEWICCCKILKRKKDWNSISNLRFLKYLWFLLG